MPQARQTNGPPRAGPSGLGESLMRLEARRPQRMAAVNAIETNFFKTIGDIPKKSRSSLGQ